MLIKWEGFRGVTGKSPELYFTFLCQKKQKNINRENKSSLNLLLCLEKRPNYKNYKKRVHLVNLKKNSFISFNATYAFSFKINEFRIILILDVKITFLCLFSKFCRTSWSRKCIVPFSYSNEIAAFLI